MNPFSFSFRPILVSLAFLALAVVSVPAALDEAAPAAKSTVAPVKSKSTAKPKPTAKPTAAPAKSSAATTPPPAPAKTPSPVSAPDSSLAPSRSVLPDAPILWNPKNTKPLAPTDLVGPYILVDESLPQIVALLERLSGKSILRTQTLPALKINFNSPKKITRAEAVSAFESLLALNGINIVPVEGTSFYKATLTDASSLEAPPLYTDAAAVAALAPSERTITRLYVLQNTPATPIAAALGTLTNKTRGDSVTPFVPSNAILFTSSITNVQRAEKIVASLDSPNAVLLYPLKHLRASDLKKQIQSLQTGANPLQNIFGGDITLEADDLANQLMVVTQPANREKIKALIAQLDQTNVTLKIHPVRYLRASEIKKLIQNLQGDGGAKSGGGEGQPGPPGKSAPGTTVRNALRNTLLADFTLEADDLANQLLVITQPDNHEKVLELITRLDKSNMALQFYEIKFLRATDIKKLIESLKSGGGAPASGEGESRRGGSGGSSGATASNAFRNTLVGDFIIEADNLANRLMVVTQAANHEKIREIISQMDRNNMSLEFHDIKHLRATDIKKLIESFKTGQNQPQPQNSRGGGNDEGRSATQNPDFLRNLLGGEFIIEADDLANRLMVLTQPENHKKIREIIVRMDQNNTTLKFYEIKFLRSSDIKKLIESLKTGQSQNSGGGSRYSSYYDSDHGSSKQDTFRNLLGGDFVIESNDLANRLMVIAQPEIQTKIQEIIREMDQNTSELMVFKITNLKATKVKKFLETLKSGQSQNSNSNNDDYYYGYRSRSSNSDNARSLLGGDITIEADDYANQLLIVAQPQVREKIRALIAQLDQNNLPQTTSEIVGLKHSEVESAVRTLATVVTGKSNAVQAEGGTNTNRGSTNTARPAGINGVSTTINSYRTFSFTNRSGDENASRGNDYWYYRYNSSRQDADASASPNSFSEYVTVTGDERTNRLMLFGTPGDIKQIKEILAKIDAPLPQVRIEAVIVEVTLSNGESSGLDSLGLGYKSVAGVGTVNGPDYNFAAGTPTTPGASIPPFSVTGSLRDFSLSVLFGLAERNTRVRILSSPTISTSHNQPATIFVGEEHPVVTSSLNDLSNTSSTRSTIEFKQIGLSLSVVPRVGTDGSVEMKVDQSNQSISRTVTVDGNEQPITANRSASSYLIAADNETIVLAGLQSYREMESTGVMWLLGRIPLLGRLFQPETSDSTRTEIIIFLKPHILEAGASPDKLPGLTPGSLTRPDAKSYLETGRFDALSLTDAEREALAEMRQREKEQSAQGKKENAKPKD